MAVVALDRREAHEVLTRGADRVDRERMADEPGGLTQRVLSLPRVLADEELRVPQLGDVVVDVEIDPVA